MKIRWIEVVNFRKFTGPVRVSGIGDGINVLVGHNEIGKSTLLAAINGVVFEKAKAQTQQTRSFRHFAHRTVPEVSLGFELNGKNWILKKRFAGPAGKALLECSDGMRCEDEEAEAELQRLLGITVSGRTTEPGIWGALWVRQRHSFGDPALDERARRTLQGCLEAQVGVVTGGLRGQRIPEAVERALAAIVSSRGPRGNYKDACDKLAEAAVQIGELEAKRKRLFEEMDSLERFKRELRNLNEDWDEQANREQTEAARERRSAAERKSAEINAARSEATLASERAQRARANVVARVALVAELGSLERLADGLQRKVEAAEASKSAAAIDLTTREGSLRDLNDRERKVAEEGRRLQRVRDAALLGAEMDRYEAVVSRVEKTQLEAEQLGEQIGRITATPALVERIGEAEVKLAAATAALNAVATTVAFSINMNSVERISIDGLPIRGTDTARVVVEDMVIGVEGVGQIAIRPQIKDKKAVLERVEEAKRTLKTALEAAGVEDPAIARTEAARRQELERRLQGLRSEVTRQVPGDKKIKLAPGLDALKVKIEELRGQRNAAMASLRMSTLPQSTDVDSELRQNIANSERLAAEVKTAEAGLEGPRKAVEDTKDILEACRRELAAEKRNLDTKKAELAAGEASDEALVATASELERDAREREAAVALLEQARGETVEEIDVTIKRLENTARTYREEAARLRSDIAKISGMITASEGDGVEEALDAALAEQSRLDAEVTNYKQEVAILELLRDTLRTAESEAKAQYLAPVVTRVEPYLRMLLPGADLVLDENFQIAAVKRSGLEEEFSSLSEGTQEQIAVLTRLAFAEVLLDQGRPATVILDDALVFSDDDRIERMFNIMTRAASRVQIIVLTCRKRLFTRLGAPMLRIEGDRLASQESEPQGPTVASVKVLA